MDKPKMVVDCIGISCPYPVFEAKKSMDKLREGEIMELRADDPAAGEDITRWARRTGNDLLKMEKREKTLYFFIRKGRGQNV